MDHSKLVSKLILALQSTGLIECYCASCVNYSVRSMGEDGVADGGFHSGGLLALRHEREPENCYPERQQLGCGIVHHFDIWGISRRCIFGLLPDHLDIL